MLMMSEGAIITQDFVEKHFRLPREEAEKLANLARQQGVSEEKMFQQAIDFYSRILQSAAIVLNLGDETLRCEEMAIAHAMLQEDWDNMPDDWEAK